MSAGRDRLARVQHPLNGWAGKHTGLLSPKPRNFLQEGSGGRLARHTGLAARSPAKQRGRRLSKSDRTPFYLAEIPLIRDGYISGDEEPSTWRSCGGTATAPPGVSYGPVEGERGGESPLFDTLLSPSPACPTRLLTRGLVFKLTYGVTQHIFRNGDDQRAARV